ncbi:MAG: oligosaccharide flippase family protein [Patescibacteria group bacterium]
MKKIKQIIYRLFKWSEKYLKTDMIYFTKGGFWLTLETVSASVFGLLLTIGFANLLPKESFGTYKYMISLADIVAILSLSGMATAVTQSVARGFDGVLRKAFWMNLKWGTIMFIVSIVGAVYYFINDNNTLAIGFLFIGALTPLQKSAGLYDAFLKGKKDFRTKTIYGIIRSFISISFLIITIFLTDNPLIILFVYLASHTLAALIFDFITLKRFKVKMKENYDPLSINFGKHLSFVNIAGKLASQLDNILVFHYLGAIQLAIYTFALAPLRHIGKLNMVIKELAFPKISSKSIRETKSGILHKTLILFLGMGIIAVLYIIAAPYIFKFLFPQYMGSVFFSQIIILSLLIPSTLIGETFDAHLRKKEIYIIRTTVPIIKIILLLVLLPFYGIWGAIAATLIGNFLNFIFCLFFFRKL